MRKIIFIIFFWCMLCMLSNRRAYANDIAAFQALQQSVESLQKTVLSLHEKVEAQNEMIYRQAAKIDALEKGRSISIRQTSTETTPPSGAPKTAGLAQGLNPDIGVVGTVQANLTENHEDAEGQDTIALKELELSLSQYVDPYSRLDAIIAFNDNLEAQNVDIEEAYYSHWGLPFGFQGQIGKFRSKIGKQNLLHVHQLDTVDYPLVIRDFFGEEGLASSGVRLQNMIPNPWDIPIEVTGEVLRGNNGTSFSGISRRPIFNTHAKSFFEITKDSNFELGWTTLFGDENPPFSVLDDNGEEIPFTAAKGRDKYGVQVYGADATLNWLLSEGRALKFQNELYFQRRGTQAVHTNEDPWGFYSLLDLRVSPKFSVGLRFDYLQPLDNVRDFDALQSTGISPYITFWQSEFANFRLQYSHLEPANNFSGSDDAIYLQANFLIGAHKHPVQ